MRPIDKSNAMEEGFGSRGGAAKGAVSRRGAEALGRRAVVPVAAVAVNPTFIPSRPRGFARTPFVSVKTSREAARTRKEGQWGQIYPFDN